MFCPSCGNAIQMVPDYDATLEESIAITTDEISDSISEITPDGHRKVDEDTLQIPGVNRQVNMVKKTRLAIGIAAALVFIAFLITFFGIKRYRAMNNPGKLYETANLLMEEGNYREAAEKYAILLKEDIPADVKSKATVNYSKCLVDQGDETKALIVLTSFLETDPTSPGVIQEVLDIYVSQGKVKEINKLINSLPDANIASRFTNYLCVPPAFSLPEGEYDEDIVIEMKGIGEGRIYYELNGKKADASSKEYSGPVSVGEGETTISAVFINKYGLMSDENRAHYSVTYGAPDELVITPHSGRLNQPDYICVEVPEGMKAYYTEDGTDPDENSEEYVNPLTMKLGHSVIKFICISDRGLKSKVSSVTYDLNVVGTVNSQSAVSLTMAGLVATGKIVDIFGHAPGVNGVYQYKCERAARQGNRSYFLVEEYITNTDGEESATGDTYAVDAVGGSLYRAKLNSKGEWMFTLFY